jgi:hypothetical protein
MYAVETPGDFGLVFDQISPVMNQQRPSASSRADRFLADAVAW